MFSLGVFIQQMHTGGWRGGGKNVLLRVFLRWRFYGFVFDAAMLFLIPHGFLILAFPTLGGRGWEWGAGEDKINGTCMNRMGPSVGAGGASCMKAYHIWWQNRGFVLVLIV